MSVREQILREVQRRLYLVPGVQLVLRNPVAAPHQADLPAISIYSSQVDDIINSSMEGDYPVFARSWPIMVVPYIVGSGTTHDDEIAETEINPFLDLVRKEIYRGGANLGGLASLVSEDSTGQLLKPYRGEAGIGLPITFSIHYVDNVNDLFI